MRRRPAVQRQSFDKLHREKRDGWAVEQLFQSSIKNVDYPGMIQLSEDLHLGKEPCLQVRRDQSGMDHLHGNLPADQFLLRPPHRTHPTIADFLDKLVAASKNGA